MSLRDWRPIKNLNAPEGYNWQDEDVLHEKNDSWLTGLSWGWSIGVIFVSVFSHLACR